MPTWCWSARGKEVIFMIIIVVVFRQAIFFIFCHGRFALCESRSDAWALALLDEV